MKKISLFIILLLQVILIHHVRAEGTAEIEPDGTGNPCKLHLSKYTNSSSPDYNNFALYTALPNERLQITIGAVGEIIYFGFSPNGNNPQISCRIKNSAGTPVWGPQILPSTAGNQGHIATYNQAVIGPDVLPGGTGGYNALSYTPTTTGDYYIEFDFVASNNNETRTFEYFDITVANASGQKVPGRVWSKAWQFTTDGMNNTSTAVLYPYTDDGITTSIDLNGISPYRFAVSCNQTGCSATGNIVEDRKSVTGKHTYPQYRIFLHEPDHSISYFPVGELGVLQAASISSTNCDGSVWFSIIVNKAGSVNLTLSFPGSSYFTRVLPATVIGGASGNLIYWDGLDQMGAPIPNGQQVDISVSYINGLTNLPMYDAEYMNSSNYPTWTGLIVDLVSPSGSKPPLFWDDTKITGCNPPAGSNYTGCTTLTGCHPWNYCIGDVNTINTWWYALSTSTISLVLTFKRSPGSLGPITGATTVCLGAGQKTYSVPMDPNSTSYNWTWPAGVTPVSTPPFSNSIILNFTTNAVSGNITVCGTNSDCGNGAVSTLAVTIAPLPSLTTSLSHSTCSGASFSIPLTSSPSGSTFSWTNPPPSCSSNITSCPPGSTGSSISGPLSVTNLVQGNVTYYVTPTLNTCIGQTQSLIITVDPKPNLTSPTSPSENLCSGGTTNIVLASGLTGASINWNVLPGGCTNIQNCPTSGSTSPITNQLSLVNNGLPGSVVYTITPSMGGCNGDPVSHTVNVLQLPPVQLASFSPVCLNTPPFALSGGTPVGGIYTLSGVPITTFDPSVVGIGSHSILYTYTNANGCTSSDNKNMALLI